MDDRESIHPRDPSLAGTPPSTSSVRVVVHSTRSPAVTQRRRRMRDPCPLSTKRLGTNVSPPWVSNDSPFLQLAGSNLRYVRTWLISLPRLLGLTYASHGRYGVHTASFIGRVLAITQILTN